MNNSNKIKSYGEKWFLLPVLSALLVIATLPPIKIWWLCFVCLVPIYLFTRISQTYPWKRTALGGFLFGIIFTAFILSLTVFQFHWVKETYLFTQVVRLSSIFILVFIGIFASAQILLLRIIQSNNALVHIIYASGCWTFSEWCTHKLMFSIEYSIIGYPAHNTTFALLAQYGGVYMTIFAIALINMSIGSLIYYWIQRKGYDNATSKIASEIEHTTQKRTNTLNIKRSISVLVFCAFIALLLHASMIKKENAEKSSGNISTINLALIQNQDKDQSPFGEEKIDTQTGETYFSFPRLQELVLEAQRGSSPTSTPTSVSTLVSASTSTSTSAPTANDPLVIIYPFAPWNGAIADKKDKNLFNKKVIATDFETFSNWIKLYVKKDNIFVVWNTTLRDGLFYNEIHFWKNGELIGYTQKKLLFPFLDYTPKFSQKIGMYTTPIDSSPGSATVDTLINGRSVGALVCSEVTHSIQTTNAKDRDLIFAIGSEALFSSGVAGEFNLGNTVYRAIESNTPIVRANRLGPSAIINNNGTILAELGFGKEGVLHGTIDVPKKMGGSGGSISSTSTSFDSTSSTTTSSGSTPFEHGGQDIFIVSVMILTATLYYRSRFNSHLH